MSCLHILNKSDDEAAAPVELLRVLQSGDTVLLIENAVLLGRKESAFYQAVTKIAGSGLLALAPDCALRGVATDCDQVEFSEFVELTAQHPKSISWF